MPDTPRNTADLLAEITAEITSGGDGNPAADVRQLLRDFAVSVLNLLDGGTVEGPLALTDYLSVGSAPLASVGEIRLPNGAAIMQRNAGDTGDEPWGAVLMSSKHITAAQLLDLHNTPIELLPAPGGRFYYVVHSVIFHYRFGTAPFTGLFTPAVGYGAAIADLWDSGDFGAGAILSLSGWGVNVVYPDFVSLTEDAYIQAIPEGFRTKAFNAWLASETENKAVSIANDPNEAVTGGDGTLSVRTFYSLIDGAP